MTKATALTVPRTLTGILFAALLAMSLVATTAEALAASISGDGTSIVQRGPFGTQNRPKGPGAFWLGVTWEE